MEISAGVTISEASRVYAQCGGIVTSAGVSCSGRCAPISTECHNRRPRPDSTHSRTFGAVSCVTVNFVAIVRVSLGGEIVRLISGRGVSLELLSVDCHNDGDVSAWEHCLILQ